MFLATKHLLAAWGHGISGTHSFSIDQSMRVAREKGLYFSNVWVVIVAQLVFCYSDRESLGPRSRRVRANIPFFALGLPFPAMLLESRVPGLVKEYLDTILPEQAQVVTHALFVAAPSIFLSGFFPAWSVLKIVCEVIVWLVLVTIALVVLAIETAVYASTLLLVASAWAFVYRDVARYVLLRSSSKYRSTMRAREVEHLAHNYFILDDRFRALQAQLDMLLPEEDQSSLQISVPFDALDMFDKKNAALARAKKAEVAAHRAILDAVLDWKNRKNALEIQRLKQD
ncbi:hypothetical protein JCM6882_000332 [Rhodosporidiobolus microsporus]